MSARFNPAARTRTRTRSRVAGGASGTSRISRPSTPPNETMVIAFILRSVVLGAGAGDEVSTGSGTDRVSMLLTAEVAGRRPGRYHSRYRLHLPGSLLQQRPRMRQHMLNIESQILQSHLTRR